MAGPFGIEQVDVPSLLSVYSGAQDRRVNQMLLQRKLALEDRQLAQQETISKAYRNLQPPGQAKGGGQSAPAGGLANAYAPTPVAAPATAAPPASFGRGTPTGSPLSPAGFQPDPIATALPQASPQQPMQPPQGWYEANKGVVDSLLTVAPQQAFELMGQLQGLDNGQLKRAAASAETMAGVAEHLHSFPEGPARQAEIQRITPDLVASGVPIDKIQGVDTSDKGLQWLFIHGNDLKTVIAREKDERQDAETARHNRATETTAAGNLAVNQGALGVKQGALGLARTKEGRIAAKATNGDVGGLSTSDLIRMAEGN